jgi:chemotaxis signal transduction protein
MNTAQIDPPNLVNSIGSINRYILASFGDKVLVFADIFVAEIMLVERTFILPLPFFVPSLIGLAHHQGRLTPLLSLARLLKDPNTLIPEIVSVVCLKTDSGNPDAEDVAGAGLVVDRVVGSVSPDQFADLIRQDSGRYLTLEQLLPQIPAHIWQPKRWHSLY